jgi:pimeloyl-ACP methyl ester carboxylesterase
LRGWHRRGCLATPAQARLIPAPALIVGPVKWRSRARSLWGWSWQDDALPQRSGGGFRPQASTDLPKDGPSSAMSHPHEIEDGDKLFLRAGPRDPGRPERFLSYVLHPGSAQAGVTVFFVHGAGGNKHQWRHQWRHLAGKGSRLVAWDALGHGASVQPHDWRSFAASSQLADFLEVLQRFGKGRHLIVAHSFGVRLTLAALQHLKVHGGLDRVAAALLLGPPSPTRPVGGAVLALPSFVLELLRNVIAGRFGRLAWHPDADRALVAHERELARRNRLFTIKAMVRQAPVLDPRALAQLSVPVEIAVGDTDGMTPVDHARELQGLLPGARLHVVPRCGHQLMLERPDAINALIDAAIERSEAAPGEP